MGHLMTDGSRRDAYQDAAILNGPVGYGGKGNAGPTDLVFRVRHMR